jgi:hypothetical protein
MTDLAGLFAESETEVPEMTRVQCNRLFKGFPKLRKESSNLIFASFRVLKILKASVKDVDRIFHL